MADAPDHSSCCAKNENYLGFKVADGQDHFIPQNFKPNRLVAFKYNLQNTVRNFLDFFSKFPTFRADF